MAQSTHRLSPNLSAAPARLSVNLQVIYVLNQIQTCFPSFFLRSSGAVRANFPEPAVEGPLRHRGRLHQGVVVSVVAGAILVSEQGDQRYYCTTGMGETVGPRLRELAPAARESQEAGFTQPRDHLLADPCISPNAA